MFHGWRSATRRGRAWCGRSSFSVCSPLYRTGASLLADAKSDLPARVLYVVGGLYGNWVALDALVEMIRAEARREQGVGVVFNGDFNFFNATVESWQRVNSRIQTFRESTGAAAVVATAGNIEFEIASTPASEPVGCGCAYPAQVPPEVGIRASQIITRLHAVARSTTPNLVTWLSTLPTHSTWRVGQSRIGVIHGDPDCMNGWALAAEALDTTLWATTSRAKVHDFFERAGVDVIACTHTCLAYLDRFDGGRAVINNGSAGMANFSGTVHGLVTRVSAFDVDPCSDALYSAALLEGGARVEAVPLQFDLDRWRRQFESIWPPNSPAYSSYHDRIVNGVPHWPVDRADFVKRRNT